MTSPTAPPLPLTASQQGLLVTDRLTHAGTAYNVLVSVELDPAVPADRVRAALEHTVAVQPALRQTFPEPLAPHGVLTEPHYGADFPYELAEDAGDAHRDALERLGALRLDLAHGPLFHCVHVRSRQRSTLVLVVHHVVFDAFSLNPFLADLACFLALPDGQGPPRARRLLNARTVSYGRELTAQATAAASEATRVRAEELADKLRGADPLTLRPLPDRPDETGFSGARVLRELDEAQTKALDVACRDLGVTQYEFLMTGYGATLARYAGTSAATVGSPFLARRTVGSFHLAGFFVNTLPVTWQFDWSGDFAAAARDRVRPAVGFTRTRADVPFGKVVEILRPVRRGNRNPVFSCMLAMQDEPQAQAPVLSARVHGNDTAKFDLWLGATPTAGRLRLELEYDRALFSDAYAESFADSLLTALCRAAAHPGTPLAALYDDASLAASTAWDGHWSEPAAPTLAQWARRTAAADPGRPAIHEPGRLISHAELEEEVSRTATGLAALGVRPGAVVGLNQPGLFDTVAGMLAVMRAGAAYLPLDPSLPAERLRYMADKAGCELVLGSPVVPGLRAVTAAQAAEAAAAGPRLEPVSAAEPASYVMFTSGSTGAPKGIHMAERALHNLTAWQIAALGLDEHTRFLQYAPLGFDVSYQEILPTLCAGGTVVSREPADRRDFPALAARMAEAEVTHVYLPVAALRPFAQAALEAGTAFPALTHVCVSGEQLVLDAEIAEFFRGHPRCALVNLYGPTETHAVTTRRMAGDPDDWPVYVPIGTPLTGVAAHVVDAAGRLAPDGVPGELFLGGACPALGYKDDPERTAQAFVPDRFLGAGTMYRTGDQVVRDDAGELVFLGRGDDQVKIRGYRVELGEIEAVSRAADGVRLAVAAVRQTTGQPEIVLFAVGSDQARADLPVRLAERLPAYMLPAHLVAVDAIPSTGNGKVDRAALLAAAERDGSFALRPGGEVRYADALEKELAELWAELLGCGVVEPDRSLMDYGAHSLLIFQAVGMVRKRYGVALSIVDVFRGPTVAALADKVRQGAGDGGPARR